MVGILKWWKSFILNLSLKSTGAILHPELKSHILTPIEGNNQGDKMNSERRVAVDSVITKIRSKWSKF